jgi:hypothetical protein
MKKWLDSVIEMVELLSVLPYFNHTFRKYQTVLLFMLQIVLELKKARLLSPSILSSWNSLP